MREKMDWSYETVAQKISMYGVAISYGTIRNWESGETVPDANELQVLAVVFESDANDFYRNVKG